MNTEIEVIGPDDKQAVQMQTDQACQLAESIKVTTPALYIEAGTALLSVKAAQKVVQEKEDKILKPLKASMENLKAFFSMPKERLKRAEGLLKRERLAFEDAERERAKILQAALEAKANEERRKTEEKAREMAAKAKELEAAGKTRRAEEMQAKANMMAEVSASIIAPTIQADPPRTAGIVGRETYSAVVTSLEDLILSAAAGILQDRDFPVSDMIKMKSSPIQALEANQIFLNQQARALKIKGDIYPGVRGVMTRGIAAGSK